MHFTNGVHAFTENSHGAHGSGAGTDGQTGGGGGIGTHGGTGGGGGTHHHATGSDGGGGGGGNVAYSSAPAGDSETFQGDGLA